jgi:hypothetical protein
MHVYFSNSLLQSKKKKKEHLVVDDSLIFFFLIYPDGSAFVTILPLISVSVRYICIAFFHSRILFFSGYTHSIHTSTKIPDKTHTTHTKRTFTHTKNKKKVTQTVMPIGRWTHADLFMTNCQSTHPRAGM